MYLEREKRIKKQNLIKDDRSIIIENDYIKGD